jgi:LAGLIDADG DNA endonuclease family protein
VGSREARNLSSRCGEIVVGTILGDGCLERNGLNVRLRIDHSVSQKAFVEWKFRQVQELDPSFPKLVHRFDSRTQKLHVNYRFATKTTPLLNSYFSVFYGSYGRKHIPQSIASILTTPLSLAVWYMDDGGRRGDCRSGYLNTNAYSVEDVEVLKECLFDRFGIRTATHFAAGKPRIYIPSSQFRTFCELVGPEVIEEMRYKLL